MKTDIVVVGPGVEVLAVGLEQAAAGAGAELPGAAAGQGAGVEQQAGRPRHQTGHPGGQQQEAATDQRGHEVRGTSGVPLQWGLFLYPEAIWTAGSCCSQGFLTPSLTQPVKFPGRNVHTCSPADSVFGGPITDNKSAFNATHFDRSPLMCSCEEGNKAFMISNLALLLVVF